MMRKIRLLIIEEHIAVLNALQVRLRSSANIEVVAAVPTFDDWDKAFKHVMPDVVLLSMKSNGRHRLSFTINVIKEFAQRGIAIIVLASFADEVERELLLEAGAHRYLLKDINSSQLISEIETLAAEKVH